MMPPIHFLELCAVFLGSVTLITLAIAFYKP